MYTLALRIDNDIIKAIQTTLKQAPSIMGNNFNKRTLPIRQRLLQVLQTEPPTPKYPLRLKSERQRRWLFATKAGGRGLGASRTHDFAQGWSILYRVSATDFTIAVDNPSDATRFIVGENQQPFHADTGWVYAPDLLAQFEIDIQEQAIAAWVETHDQILSRRGA